MKEVLIVSTYVVGFGELILALYLWATSRSSPTRKVVGFLAFSTSIWVLSSVFVAYRLESSSTTIASNLTYTAGVFLLTSLLHFSLIYPSPIIRVDRLHIALLYIPAFIFSTISMTSNSIEGRWVADQANVGQVVGGPVLPIYNVFLLLLFLASIAILLHRLPHIDGINRSNVILLLASIFIAGLPAVIIDLVLTNFSIPTNYLYGNIASGIWLGAMGYILSKK